MMKLQQFFSQPASQPAIDVVHNDEYAVMVVVMVVVAAALQNYEISFQHREEIKNMNMINAELFQKELLIMVALFRGRRDERRSGPRGECRGH